MGSFTRIVFLAAVAVTVAACSAGLDALKEAAEEESSTTTDTTTTGNDATTGESKTADKSLAGDWYVLTKVIYFDNGQTSKDVKTVPITTPLKLSADGKWQFSSSTGSWSAAALADSDWEGWKVPSYGPTRKLVLNGWSDGTGKGPIEETDAGVDFIWVIYPYVSDANGPGTVWLKFYKRSS